MRAKRPRTSGAEGLSAFRRFLEASAFSLTAQPSRLFADLRPRSGKVFGCELAFFAGLCTIGRRGRLRSAWTPTLRRELTQKFFKIFSKNFFPPIEIIFVCGKLPPCQSNERQTPLRRQKCSLKIWLGRQASVEYQASAWQSTIQFQDSCKCNESEMC